MTPAGGGAWLRGRGGPGGGAGRRGGCGLAGAAGQAGAVPAEGEHRQRDEGFGGAKSERNPGQQPDLGVDRFDEALGQAVVECGVDGLAVFDDAAGQRDGSWDAAAPRPADPPVQGLFAVGAFDRKDVPEALFEQIRAVQPGVGLGDPGQSGVLMFGEVVGVLPQRIAGVLELTDPLMARSGPLAGRAAAVPFALAAGQHPRVVPGPASFVIEGPGGPADHVEGIGTADRLGLRWVTTSAIQPAASADTWVIWAHRAGPSPSKKRFKVGLSRPAAAQISRPLSWSTTTVMSLWNRL